MLVEPASLCWLAGRKAPTRDGVTWAAELERWSALRAVVRDGATGLSKGIELVRARRREQQGADLEDGLDVSTPCARAAVPCGRPGPRRAVPWSRLRRRSSGTINGVGRDSPTAATGRR